VRFSPESQEIVHAELVLIHPFRDGNGRCARLLSTLMGVHAGLPPLPFASLHGIGKCRYEAAVRAQKGFP
jgi:cell filamentation protein